MEAVQCSLCGRPIEGADVLYTTSGNPSCAPCVSNVEIAQLERRAGKNITSAAISSLGFAFISWIFNPVFLMTMFSVSSAIYAMKSLRPDNERFAQHVTSRGTVVALAVTGLVVSGLRVLLGALAPLGLSLPR